LHFLPAESRVDLRPLAQNRRRIELSALTADLAAPEHKPSRIAEILEKSVGLIPQTMRLRADQVIE
jgi:hypothetical protein